MSVWEMKICCMGAGYVGGTSMAVMASQCPKVRNDSDEQGRRNRHLPMIQSDSCLLLLLMLLFATKD